MVVPNLDDLKRRLDFIDRPMQGSEFSREEKNDHIALSCPWGNDIRAYGPGFGTSLGIPFAVLDVPPNTAEGICRFYHEVLETPAHVETNGGTSASVSMGGNQRLIFQETDADIPAYDGHHIAIYVANFSRPHAALAERGLVSEESYQHQYLFQVDRRSLERRGAHRNRTRSAQPQASDVQALSRESQSGAELHELHPRPRRVRAVRGPR